MNTFFQSYSDIGSGDIVDKQLRSNTIRGRTLNDELILVPRPIWYASNYDITPSAAGGWTPAVTGAFVVMNGSYAPISTSEALPPLAGFTREFRFRAQYQYQPGASTTGGNAQFRLSGLVTTSGVSDPGAPYNVLKDVVYTGAWQASTNIENSGTTATFCEFLGNAVGAAIVFVVRFVLVEGRYKRV